MALESNQDMQQESMNPVSKLKKGARGVKAAATKNRNGMFGEIKKSRYWKPVLVGLLILSFIFSLTMCADKNVLPPELLNKTLYDFMLDERDILAHAVDVAFSSQGGSDYYRRAAQLLIRNTGSVTDYTLGREADTFNANADNLYNKTLRIDEDSTFSYVRKVAECDGYTEGSFRTLTSYTMEDFYRRAGGFEAFTIESTDFSYIKDWMLEGVTESFNDTDLSRYRSLHSAGEKAEFIINWLINKNGNSAATDYEANNITRSILLGEGEMEVYPYMYKYNDYFTRCALPFIYLKSMPACYDTMDVRDFKSKRDAFIIDAAKECSYCRDLDGRPFSETDFKQLYETNPDKFDETMELIVHDCIGSNHGNKQEEFELKYAWIVKDSHGNDMYSDSYLGYQDFERTYAERLLSAVDENRGQYLMKNAVLNTVASAILLNSDYHEIHTLKNLLTTDTPSSAALSEATEIILSCLESITGRCVTYETGYLEGRLQNNIPWANAILTRNSTPGGYMPDAMLVMDNSAGYLVFSSTKTGDTYNEEAFLAMDQQYFNGVYGRDLETIDAIYDQLWELLSENATVRRQIPYNVRVNHGNCSKEELEAVAQEVVRYASYLNAFPLWYVECVCEEYMRTTYNENMTVTGCTAAELNYLHVVGQKNGFTNRINFFTQAASYYKHTIAPPTNVSRYFAELTIAGTGTFKASSSYAGMDRLLYYSSHMYHTNTIRLVYTASPQNQEAVRQTVQTAAASIRASGVYYVIPTLVESSYWMHRIKKFDGKMCDVTYFQDRDNNFNTIYED